jgi:hypothetical protein
MNPNPQATPHWRDLMKDFLARCTRNSDQQDYESVDRANRPDALFSLANRPLVTMTTTTAAIMTIPDVKRNTFLQSPG